MSMYGNPYFPVGYNPYQQGYQQFQQNMAQTQQPQVAAQTQNSGFVRVQNETQAREYPVALGDSVTFINENAPYCYTKSMGLSQLESPVFKRFRLVEEDMQNTQSNIQQSQIENIDLSQYISKNEFETLKISFETLKNEFENMKKELM